MRIFRAIFRTIVAVPALVALLLAQGTFAQAAADQSIVSNYIVVFTPGADRANEVALAKTAGLEVGREYQYAFSGMTVKLTQAQLTAMSQRPTVAHIEQDSFMTVSDTQNAPTWGLDRIDQASLPLSASYNYPANAGKGVNVYIIDTGILSSHTDFGGRVAPGWSAIGSTTDTTDCNGHGTHVAGTVAGTTYGVAKVATLIPVRVLDCTGAGSTSDVAAGIDWAVGNHQPGTAAVANLSLGGGVSSVIDSAINALVNDGVTVAVAAGNSSADACNYSPARVPNALTVAATNSSDTQASFSNFGSCVDIYAPGVGITSDWFTSSTASATLNGTSMASPHVAGTAAVILGQKPTLTPAEVASYIRSMATPNVVKTATAGTPNRLLFSSPTALSDTVATAPLAPNTVNAVAGSKSATVSWKQGSDGGSPVTIQTVYVINGGKTIASLTVVGTATTVKVTGLTVGKSYSFSVSATNAVGSSALSAPSNVITALK